MANQRRVLTVVAFAILTAGALLAWLGPLARGWPAAIQIALLVAIVSILGTAMGMPFPTGLRRINAIAPAHVPWAWAINGCVSVATPAGAVLLAMHSGFTALFVAGALAYFVAVVGTSLPPHTDARFSVGFPHRRR